MQELVYANHIIVLAKKIMQINLRIQQYFYYADNKSIIGYKISDLIKKPNLNMGNDPIDWIKADIVFSRSTTYNNRQVRKFVFVDLDNNTYTFFLGNSADEKIGPDKGRETSLTTTCQPSSKLLMLDQSNKNTYLNKR